MDLLDRKILYQLDRDSRQSAKDIARLVKSNKDTVNYRINRMVSEGVIAGFTTHIDPAKFGFTNIKTYIRFQDTSERKEEEFFSFLESLPEVGWVVHASGRWDALFCAWASSTFSFYRTLSKIMDRFSKNIDEKEIIHNINWFYYNRKWLLPELHEVHAVKYGGEPARQGLDKADLDILKEMAGNARARFSDVSRKTGVSPQNVLNRVKSMRKRGVITKYGVDINYDKLGLVFCKTFIRLHNITDESLDAIYAYCAQEPRMFALTTTVGPWDLELEMEVERMEDMMEMMNRVKRAFPDSIKGYDSIVITKQSQINYLPVV